MKTARRLLLAVPLLLLASGCSSSAATTSDERTALEEQLAEVEQELAGITAERDALAAQLEAAASRFAKSTANLEEVGRIIDDPDSFGTKGEVLDLLMTYATDNSVMDDTAFGAVPMRQAWSNTLWGLDATITTWARWVCDDGSQAGSLWTWAGTAGNGEPFELVGVNLDDYDDEGRITYSLVDWPYEGAYVRGAISQGTGGDASDG